MNSHENSRTYSTTSHNTYNNSPVYKRQNHIYNINIEESKNDDNEQIGVSSPKAYDKFMNKIKLYYYLKHPTQRAQTIFLNTSCKRSTDSSFDSHSNIDNKENSDKEEHKIDNEKNVVIEKQNNTINQAGNERNINIFTINYSKDSHISDNIDMLYNNEKKYIQKRTPFNENILIIDNEDSNNSIEYNNNYYEDKFNNNEKRGNHKIKIENINKNNIPTYNIPINNDDSNYNPELNNKNVIINNYSNNQNYTNYQEQQIPSILSNIFHNYEPTSQNSFKDKEFISVNNNFSGNFPNINIKTKGVSIYPDNCNSNQSLISFGHKTNNVTNGNYYEQNKNQNNDINFKNNQNNFNNNYQTYSPYGEYKRENNNEMRVDEPVFLNVKKENNTKIFENKNNNLDFRNISNTQINDNYIERKYYSPKFNNNVNNNSKTKVDTELKNNILEKNNSCSYDSSFNKQKKIIIINKSNGFLTPKRNDKNQKENQLTALLYGLIFGVGTTSIFWLSHQLVREKLYEKIKHLNIDSVINFFKHILHPITFIKSILNNKKLGIYKRVFKLSFVKIFDYFEGYGDPFRILCSFIIIYSFWLIVKNYLRNMLKTWKYYNQ